MKDREKKGRFRRICTELVRRYYNDELSRTGAELAYYMLFSLFPLMIFISALLSRLQIEPGSLTESALRTVLPGNILELLETYFAHINTLNSDTLLVFGAVLTLYFFSRAVNSVMSALRRAYRPEKESRWWVRLLLPVLFTVMLMVMLVVTLTLQIAGRTLMEWLAKFLPLSDYAVDAWNILRFVAIALIVFFVLLVLYAASHGKRNSLRSAIPGALFVMFAWVVLSVGFSFYVENMNNYSVIYGSLGAVMVLMLWLYLIGVVLVLGGTLNHILLQERAGALADLPLFRWRKGSAAQPEPDEKSKNDKTV